jgi:hypothetical protein
MSLHKSEVFELDSEVSGTLKTFHYTGTIAQNVENPSSVGETDMSSGIGW